MASKTVIKTVGVNQLVNPWGGEERIRAELDNAAKYQTDNPEAFVCRKCQTKYQPYPYQTIYYNLCDECFIQFDRQKMEGRRATSADKNRKIKHCENVEEWVMAGDK